MNKNKATVDELIEELAKYQIILNKEILLKQYANCFHLYQLLESISLRHESQIKELNSKKGKINSKSIERVLDKLVRENYDIKDSIDPYYLLKDLQQVYNKETDKETYISIINRLLRLNELYHLNRIGGYFKMYDGECERYVYCIFDNYQMQYLTNEDTKAYIELVNTFKESFARDEELLLNLDLLKAERIAALGQEEDIDQVIKEIKNTYEISIFNIYFRVLLGTLDSDKEQLFKDYYQKLKQYMVLSDEDRQAKEMIDNLYEDVMMEEA